MEPTLRYREVATLPKLAWLSSLDLKRGTLEITHGSAVECRTDWMVEGVWDADFGVGAFHRSENFFGSGVRIENGSVYFVPSSALVDRLLYCCYKDLLLVSNSLILLLASTGASLRKDHDYRIESNAICKGTRYYKKDFPVQHKEIHNFCQLFSQSLVVTNGRMSLEGRNRERTIYSFEEYAKTLRSTLAAIRLNYEDQSRLRKCSAFSTLSSGYDSVAVSCLAREIGITTCFASVPRSKWKPSYWLFKNTGVDNGQPIADALDLKTIPLRPLGAADDSVHGIEPYFYAATCASFELIFHAMATHIERNCEAAVVFTGYHGDKVWDVNVTEKYLGDDVRRGDVSGLTISEARLKSGFINVAVPFIHARNIKNLVEISKSQEMAQWRLRNSYDRPIPRRIAETAGVGRRLFGMRKTAAWRGRSYPVNRELAREFFEFVRKNYHVRPAFILFAEKLNRITFLCEATSRWLYDRVARRLKLASSKRKADARSSVVSKVPPRRFWKDMYMNRQLFIWAANSLSARTAEMLVQQDRVDNK
jgi:hypothetical protein